MIQDFQYLPKEQPVDGNCARPLSMESRVALWLLCLSFFVLVPGCYFADDLVAYLVTLDPVRLSHPSKKFALRNLFMSAVILVNMAVYWYQCRLERDEQAPWANTRHIAFYFGLCAAVLFNFAWLSKAVHWTFLEASKIRTEQFSFARSVSFWKADSISGYAPKAEQSVWVVGSSQVNFGIDALQMQSQLGVDVRKKTLPGFGVMQYLFVADEIIDNHPAVVVCLLSEFDFFREDELPVNRMRYFSSWPAIAGLAENFDIGEIWRERTSFADLGLAAYAPVWRDRDLARKTAFDFWTPLETDTPPAGERQAEQWGRLAQGRQNLAREVKRSRLLEANFKAFENFADKTSMAGIKLLVLEGMTNPLATDVYPRAYRIETRSRLQEMSARAGFTYVDETLIPKFFARDFVDAYHLGPKARENLTSFVVKQLNKRLI